MGNFVSATDSRAVGESAYHLPAGFPLLIGQRQMAAVIGGVYEILPDHQVRAFLPQV